MIEINYLRTRLEGHRFDCLKDMYHEQVCCKRSSCAPQAVLGTGRFQVDSSGRHLGGEACVNNAVPESF